MTQSKYTLASTLQTHLCLDLRTLNVDHLTDGTSKERHRIVNITYCVTLKRGGVVVFPSVQLMCASFYRVTRFSAM